MRSTKNADSNKYGCSCYSIGFDARSQFSFLNGEWDKYVVIFEVDNSSSIHAGSRNKDILVLGEGPRDALDDATITAEAKCSINISKPKKIIFKSALQ